MNQLTVNARLTKLANGRAPELLVGVGAAAILACDLIDPTLDARIYAASEHALGSAAWLFHTGLAALFAVLILLYVRLRKSPVHRGVRRGLVIGAIGVIGVVVFPTDPGWSVVSVPGRLHPIFALLAAGSLLYVGSRLSRPRSSCCTRRHLLVRAFSVGLLVVVLGSPSASPWRSWGFFSTSAPTVRAPARSSSANAR